MRIEKMLIGIDFGAPALAGAAWALRSFAPEAEAILVHVIEPPAAPAFARPVVAAPEEIERAARTLAEGELREIAGVLTSRALRTEIRVGRPHETLAAMADELGADLLVVGPHGDGARPRKLLGTTAERLVRAAHVPVLVAASPPAGVPRRILVPVDDAAITDALLAWSGALAGRFGAEITLLHVLSNAVYSHVASMAYASASTEELAREEIRVDLEQEGIRWLESLARTGLDRHRVRSAVTFGKPGDATLAMADAVPADLIVLGRRGAGVVAPALLGSTVRTVLHGARCPVLVVTEPHDPAGESW